MTLQNTRIPSDENSDNLTLTLDQLAERSGLDKDLLLRRMASALSDRGEDIVSILAQE